MEGTITDLKGCRIAGHWEDQEGCPVLVALFLQWRGEIFIGLQCVTGSLKLDYHKVPSTVFFFNMSWSFHIF